MRIDTVLFSAELPFANDIAHTCEVIRLQCGLELCIVSVQVAHKQLFRVSESLK